jgi:hypothetical protein
MYTKSYDHDRKLWMPTENDRWRDDPWTLTTLNPLRLEPAGEDSPVRASETRGPWLDWSAAVVVE